MRLLDHMPYEYRGSPEIQVIEDALEAQLKALQAARNDLFQQLSVNRATWGLGIWEQVYGLPVDGDKPLEQRRERLVSKIRGTGTVTSAMLKNVAEGYTNGEVEVIERPEEYRFEVKFVGAAGIPPNLEDLKAAIEEIKPAHLVCGYLVLYRTWGQVANMTWGEASGYTWDELYGIIRRTWGQVAGMTWGEVSAYRWNEIFGGEY